MPESGGNAFQGYALILQKESKETFSYIFKFQKHKQKMQGYQSGLRTIRAPQEKVQEVMDHMGNYSRHLLH